MDKRARLVSVSIIVTVSMPALIGLGYLASTGKSFYTYGTHEVVVISAVIFMSGLMIKSAFTAIEKMKSEK